MEFVFPEKFRIKVKKVITEQIPDLDQSVNK